MKYSIKCTRKATGQVYYAYSGQTWTDKDRAQNEADACTKLWGDKITYEVVEAPEAPEPTKDPKLS